MSTYSPGSRDDEVDPDVTDRLASINGYGSKRDAARIGSRALRGERPDAGDEPYEDSDDVLDAAPVAGEEEPWGDDRHDGVPGGEGYASEDYGDEAEYGEEDERDTEASHEDGGPQWEGRLRPIDVHHATFPRASFTRRGYDERSVDEFLSRVESEITWLLEEKADLRDEVARVRRQVKAAQDTPVPQMEEAQAQAVRLLAKAQQLADQYVAEAEGYSKRVSQEARQQYDDIVTEGRSEAARLVDEAKDAAATIVQEAEEAARTAAERVAAERPVARTEPARPAATTGTIDLAALEQAQADKQALEEQVAYLRTFSQVTRTQLRAYLEALLTDVEEEWGRADPAAAVDGASRRTPAQTGPARPAGETSGRRRPRPRESALPPASH